MTADARPECCRDPENLFVAETQHREDGTLVTRRCKTCNRRHFEMEAKPLHVGVRVDRGT